MNKNNKEKKTFFKPTSCYHIGTVKGMSILKGLGLIHGQIKKDEKDVEINALVDSLSAIGGIETLEYFQGKTTVIVQESVETIKEGAVNDDGTPFTLEKPEIRYRVKRWE